MAYIVPFDFPPDCNQCNYSFYPSDCILLEREIEDEYERPDWCPLIEIPAGARLVDTSKLVNYHVTGNATVGGKDIGKQSYIMLPRGFFK